MTMCSITRRFFVVAFAVTFAYSLLVLFVRPGSTASRLVLLSDVVSSTDLDCF
jgi:hypothetical protein